MRADLRSPKEAGFLTHEMSNNRGGVNRSALYLSKAVFSRPSRVRSETGPSRLAVGYTSFVASRYKIGAEVTQSKQPRFRSTTHLNLVRPNDENGYYDFVSSKKAEGIKSAYGPYKITHKRRKPSYNLRDAPVNVWMGLPKAWFHVQYH